MRYPERFFALQTTAHTGTGYDWTIVDGWSDGKVVHTSLNLEQAMLIAAFKNETPNVDYTQF